MSVNDVYKGMGAGFCVSGRVETGMVQPGDKVLVSPLGETAVIKGLNYCLDILCDISHNKNKKVFYCDFLLFSCFRYNG